MAERITREEVEHVAGWRGWRLTEAEVDALHDGARARSSITRREVSALDIADVPPTAHPLPLVNVLRADEVRPSVPRDEVLAAAPAVEDDRFRVPRILGEAP